MGINLWGICFFFGGMILASIPALIIYTVEINRVIKKIRKRGRKNVKNIILKG